MHSPPLTDFFKLFKLLSIIEVLLYIAICKNIKNTKFRKNTNVLYTIGGWTMYMHCVRILRDVFISDSFDYLIWSLNKNPPKLQWFYVF